MNSAFRIIFIAAFFMGFAATTSGKTVTFSANVPVVHDKVETVYVYNCPEALDYTFISDSVKFPKFHPRLGVLTSVQLVVEVHLDVETNYYFGYDDFSTTKWWYIDVAASVGGLSSDFSEGHNHHTTGEGDDDHAFSIDAEASDSSSADLSDFIGVDSVDVDLTGDNKLCAWWNGYTHYDTDIDGVITISIKYEYEAPSDTETFCEGDFDGDGEVDGSDLAIFADEFGKSCP